MPLTLNINFLWVSCRTCRTCVELVVELVVFSQGVVELVHFEGISLSSKSFYIETYKFYIIYNKFYNKFYTSSTQVLQISHKFYAWASKLEYDLSYLSYAS